jgi:hypothetical protein
VALIVNGDPILLEEYQAALARFQAAIPDVPIEEATERVLDEFVVQLLLAQGAAEAGYTLDDALVEDRISQLVTQIGGVEKLSEWQEKNYYSDKLFRLEFRRNIAATWMRDEIISAVLESAEQVRARQIFLSSFGEAQNVYDQLEAGTGFEDLLAIYDPVGLGDLGWFPRGYLLEPIIEDVAFSLETGEYSEVIETQLGFHIIQVIDRSSERLLEPDARLVLQEKALETWLQERRKQSDITFLNP